VKCWRIGTDKGIIDTFKQVTSYIPCKPALVYRALAGINSQQTDSAYGESWHTRTAIVNTQAKETIRQMPFSDLRVFNQVFPSIPGGTLVVLGNSSIIRYAQLLPAIDSLCYYSNRGISGIDGCLSTAAGIAYTSGKRTLVITGDLGFLYDSNALWNRELPANLKILVINNGGGGIFHILKGPSDHPGFKKYIEAHHPVNIHKLAEAFGLDYFYAEDELNLRNQWDQFIKEDERATLFEVKTDAALSASTFRQITGGPQ
jgi:2-succinyl-5-enolpyruvyl-6-hydroxy-3-cyclohexene-1-carboxylate synthase